MRSVIYSEEGYTLIETLVAMALFLGVVLPLIGLLGNFSVGHSHARESEALRIAESEICRAMGEDTLNNRDTLFSHGFRLERIVRTDSSLISIIVSVSDTGTTKKKYITLEKLLLK
jgi:hypothetical protein